MLSYRLDDQAVVWRVYPKSNTLTAKVRVLIDYLMGKLGQRPPWGAVWREWRGWQESNLRPLASEANTLSTELQPRDPVILAVTNRFDPRTPCGWL